MLLDGAHSWSVRIAADTSAGPNSTRDTVDNHEAFNLLTRVLRDVPRWLKEQSVLRWASEFATALDRPEIKTTLEELRSRSLRR